MDRDILFIKHLEHSPEKFHISSARCNLSQCDDGTWEFVFSVETDKALLRDPELEEALNAIPNFEVSVVVAPSETSIHSGAKFYQKHGYDDKREENLADFYYFSHDSIEDMNIELIEVTDEWIDIQISAKAVINSGTWQDPDASFELLTRFKRDTSLTRSFT